MTPHHEQVQKQRAQRGTPQPQEPKAPLNPTTSPLASLHHQANTSAAMASRRSKCSHTEEAQISPQGIPSTSAHTSGNEEDYGKRMRPQ